MHFTAQREVFMISSRYCCQGGGELKRTFLACCTPRCKWHVVPLCLVITRRPPLPCVPRAGSSFPWRLWIRDWMSPNRIDGNQQSIQLAPWLVWVGIVAMGHSAWSFISEYLTATLDCAAADNLFFPGNHCLGVRFRPRSCPAPVLFCLFWMIHEKGEEARYGRPIIMVQ